MPPGGSMASRYVFNFYLVKNPKIAKKNSATTKAREKNSHRFGILRTLKFF
jgi:hypothetical protein